MGDDPNMINVGPVGSKNGSPWDEQGHSKIVQIFISHDDEINSIQFQYAENGSLVLSERHGSNEINSIQFQYAENGSLVLSERHGSNDGYNFDVVKLNHPTEFICWISGHKSYNNGHLCSITFGTNHGEYGPFGRFSAHDKEFNFKLGQNRQFGGFHGTADNSVKSIGVYVKLTPL